MQLDSSTPEPRKAIRGASDTRQWTSGVAGLQLVSTADRDLFRFLDGNPGRDKYRQRFGAKPPDLGFIDIARRRGVESVRVATPGELRPALDRALGAGRPSLLDVAIEGRP
jgi:hypothetical protein